MTDTTITTEAPRNDSGQFESSEPAYGVAGLERAAGYVPLETATEEPAELTKDEAAARLKELSGPESAIITHTAGLPDNVTMTLEQAADALADARGADAAQAEIDGTKAAQKEVDKLRGAKPAAPPIETEADIEKVLANPKIRDAIAERVTEAETQRARPMRLRYSKMEKQELLRCFRRTRTRQHSAESDGRCDQRHGATRAGESATGRDASARACTDRSRESATQSAENRARANRIQDVCCERKRAIFGIGQEYSRARDGRDRSARS